MPFVSFSPYQLAEGSGLGALRSVAATANTIGQNRRQDRDAARRERELALREQAYQFEFDQAREASARQRSQEQAASEYAQYRIKQFADDMAGPLQRAGQTLSKNPLMQGFGAALGAQGDQQQEEYRQLADMASRMSPQARERLFQDFQVAQEEVQRERAVGRVQRAIETAARQGLLAPEGMMREVDDGQGNVDQMDEGQMRAEELMALSETDPIKAWEALHEELDAQRKERMADEVRLETIQWGRSQYGDMVAAEGGVGQKALQMKAMLSEYETFGGDPEDLRENLIRLRFGLPDRRTEARQDPEERYRQDMQAHMKARQDFYRTLASEPGSNAEAKLRAWDKTFPPPAPPGAAAQARAVSAQDVGFDGSRAPTSPNGFEFVPGANGQAQAQQAQPQNRSMRNGFGGLNMVHAGDDPRFLDLERATAGKKIDPNSKSVRYWPAAKAIELQQSIEQAIGSAKTEQEAWTSVRRLLKGLEVPTKAWDAVRQRIGDAFPEDKAPLPEGPRGH